MKKDYLNPNIIINDGPNFPHTDKGLIIIKIASLAVAIGSIITATILHNKK